MVELQTWKQEEICILEKLLVPSQLHLRIYQLVQENSFKRCTKAVTIPLGRHQERKNWL